MTAVHPLDALDNAFSSTSRLVSSFSQPSDAPVLSLSPSAAAFPFFSSLTSSASASIHTISLSPPPAAVSDDSAASHTARGGSTRSGWGGQPPLRRHCTNLKVYASTGFLVLLFSLQLALHLAYLAASVLLLVRPSLLTDLLEGRDKPSAFVCLQALPIFLVVRSTVCIPLTVRRLWLRQRWQSTWVDATVCTVMLAATCGLSTAGLVAVSQLPSSATWMYGASWLLVSSLLLLTGWQLAMYVALLMFFRWDVLTISTPMLPLAQHYYEAAQDGHDKPEKHEGLTPQQLLALPASTYIGDRDDAVCAVCMDDVQVGQVQRVLRCGHAYHQACIDVWLLKRRVCPLCVQAVRVSDGASTAGEWVVELTETVKPESSASAHAAPLTS